MRLKYPNLKRPDVQTWELSYHRDNHILCSASKWESVNVFHTDRLYTLQVPNVPASITTTTTVSNNMTEIVVMSPTEKTVKDVITNITFKGFTSDESLSIVHISACWTHIMRAWSCAPEGAQLSKAGAVCDRCSSHMPVPEMKIIYQNRYDNADTENAQSSQYQSFVIGDGICP